MNRISILLCAVIFLLSNSICAEDAFKSRVVELVPKLSVEKEADRLEPQKELEKLEFAASIPGKEAERTAYCAAVAEALSKDLPVPGKIWLLRSLERVGREESVATEAKLMGDADENVRDAAIRALASNSSRESTMILAQALAKSTDAKTRAALINALGFKRVPDAEKLFAKDVTHADENVRVAARSALARIGHRADAGPMADAAKLIDMGRAGQPGDVAALLAALD